MNTPEMPVLVGPDGHPMRAQAEAALCPRCGAGKDKRVPSSGFGEPHDVCRICGYEWKDGQQ